MTGDGLRLVALIHRLAVVDARAHERLKRLLVIGDVEARALLRMAGGDPLRRSSLERELELSSGGAAAVAARLRAEGLVRCEADPGSAHAPQLLLSPGAERELAAALEPLIVRLEALPERDRHTIALTELIAAAGAP